MASGAKKMESTAGSGKKQSAERKGSMGKAISIPKAGTGERGKEAGPMENGGGAGMRDAGRFDRTQIGKDPYGDTQNKDMHAGRPKNEPQYGAG